MLIIEQSVQSKASPETIWKLYADHSAWPEWDKAIEFVSLHGPFEKGTKGTIKMKGGPKVSFTVSAVQKNKSFIDISQLPGAKLIFSHTLSKQDQNTLITHRVEMKGPLALLFSIIIGRQIKKDLPTALKNLATMAEKME